MSISYCQWCSSHIDEDYNVEHFDECSVPLGWEVIENNYENRLLKKFDGSYWLDRGGDLLLPLNVDKKTQSLDVILKERGLK